VNPNIILKLRAKRPNIRISAKSNNQYLENNTGIKENNKMTKMV
jgi:hypothetical protein